MITKRTILVVVSNALDASKDGILGASQKAPVTLARQFCMYYADKYTNDSLESIGRFYGNRDHSTVSYSIKTIKNWLHTDKSKRELNERMAKNIRELGKKETARANNLEFEISVYPDYINR